MKNYLSLVSVVSMAAGMLAASLSLLPSDAASPEAAADSQADVIHVLDRLTFGPCPGDIAHVQKIGIQKYIDEQLNPSNLPEPLDTTSEEFKVLNGDPIALIKQYRQFRKDEQSLQKEHKDEEAKDNRIHYFATTEIAFNKARLLRAIKSQRQLEEVMTDFWYNHFNVYAHKDADRALFGPYEQQAIRPFVLGNFKQLVTATCHHPAMLYYLDNWQNTAPDSPGARGKLKGLNENYARELMELHTLGVDGGYTQDDVIQLAKILTGLGLPTDNAKRNESMQSVDKYGAVFEPARHDNTDKKLLGHVIKASGEAEIEQAIDILVKQPATAHHIAFQLAQYFVADAPPPKLVDKLATEFTNSNGDIKKTLKALFSSPDFWDPKYEQNKFKSPFRYVVSSFRAAGTEPQRYEFIAAQLRNQGQALYGCLTPDGYKNVETAWLNPDGLLKRIAFATQFASGRLGGGQADAISSESLYVTLGGDNFFKETGPKLTKEPDRLKAALMLGSPEFMRY